MTVVLELNPESLTSLNQNSKIIKIEKIKFLLKTKPPNFV